MFLRLHGNVRRPNTGPSNRLPIGQELLKAELHLPLQFCCVAVLVVVSHLFISLTDPGVWGLDLSPSMGSRRKRAQRAACAYRLQPNRWHSSLMTKSLLGVPALRPSISHSTILGVSPSDPPAPPQPASHLRLFTLSASCQSLCCLHTYICLCSQIQTGGGFHK